MSLTPLEQNVGLAACGPLGAARPLFDTLAQGRAEDYWARQYARLSRAWGSPLEAERHVYALARVAGLVAPAIARDPRLTDDRRADLLSFIIERGMNMGRDTKEVRSS